MKNIASHGNIIGPIIIFLVIILMFVQVDRENVDQMYQREEQIEKVVKQYAIACYAQEGAYPKDLAYLQENYGLIMNEQKYFYYYDLFASNLMPDIEVVSIERGDE